MFNFPSAVGAKPNDRRMERGRDEVSPLHFGGEIKQSEAYRIGTSRDKSERRRRANDEIESTKCKDELRQRSRCSSVSLPLPLSRSFVRFLFRSPGRKEQFVCVCVCVFVCVHLLNWRAACTNSFMPLVSLSRRFPLFYANNFTKKKEKKERKRKKEWKEETHIRALEGRVESVQRVMGSSFTLVTLSTSNPMKRHAFPFLSLSLSSFFPESR